MSTRTPACHTEVLNGLYHIKDALERNAFIEAMQHVGDNTALIQNEREWCFDTDGTLTQMNAFMIQLGDSIGVLEQVHDGQHLLKKELIEIIASTINDVTQASRGLSRWQEPDTHLDLLEKNHRVNKYKG